ncbi:hypothetical protein BGZ70_003625 [Mortierella alpina]|uniref:Uncharacterized protein n=1 Tax=Mortierella alpina TaxID=64518 RepID=A0A9P6IS62_MORAP|nr:hypothetical protein BGZ70_003625 [Mortierella alpina]
MLTRGRLPRLTDLQVFNEGKTNGDIQWLKNLVSESTAPQSWQARDSKLDAQALTRLTVDGMHFQDAQWKVLFEALDFKSLTKVILKEELAKRAPFAKLII